MRQASHLTHNDAGMGCRAQPGRSQSPAHSGEAPSSRSSCMHTSLPPVPAPFPQPPSPSPAPAPQVQESALTDARDMIPAPRLDRHVFVRLLRDAGHVAVDAE